MDSSKAHFISVNHWNAFEENFFKSIHHLHHYNL